MNLILTLVQFLIGMVLVFSSVPRKYYLITTLKNWNDSRAYCQVNHDDLAIIDSPANLARLQSDPQSQYTHSAWIGMSLQPSHFLWSYKNEPLGSYSKWTIGWPNNKNGNQHCIWVFAGVWYHFLCVLKRGFICYDDSKTGNNRYIYYSTMMSWFDAQSFCRQNHTDLTSVRNSTENSIVNGKISGETWIGLHREPWKWVDQTDVTTFTWVPGQPNNALVSENCGLMTNYQVADNLCTDIYPFICHRDVTQQQQIIRLKIQSDQDLNNPTLLDAILKMIQQKLQELGMDQNITLKWREKPAGVMFYKPKIFLKCSTSIVY